jgi:hypothetical protein
MKKTTFVKWYLPTLILTVMAGYTWAQQPAPPAVTTKLTTESATVTAVYPDKRSVTLVGPHGQHSVFVGPDVKLDKIHAGDKVSDPAASTFAYKSPNGKPGGGIGASVTVTVKILGIDPGTNTVAFQQADGSQHIIEVKSDNMKAFIKTLKPGDTVDVTYTESVAISVVPAS